MAHTIQQQKNNQPNQKTQSDISLKKTYRWSVGT